MQKFLETVFHLDAFQDCLGLLQFATHGSHSQEDLLDATSLLLTKSRVRSAFILAKLLADHGCQDPVVSLALSIGGLVYDIPAEASRGLANLQTQADGMLPYERANFYRRIVVPVLPFHVMKPHLLGVTHYSTDQIQRILTIFKAIVPDFKTVFDWDAAVPSLSMQELRQRGRERANLITYPRPPSGYPRQKRHVMVVARSVTEETLGEKRRPGDLEPRIVAAMQAYGWQTRLYTDETNQSDEAHCHAVAERCRQQNIELLLLYVDPIAKNKKTSQPHYNMITQLRQENPSFKVVGFTTDVWVCDSDPLVEASNFFDMLWTVDSPLHPVWSDPAFTRKVLHAQLPHAGNFCTPNQPLIPEMLFSGSVRGFNYPRAFWLSAAEHLNLPIKIKLSTHEGDGLSALESYALYMRGLTEATCCLNLTMRSDLDHIVVGRSFEAILAGALLVQEATPGMHRYFIAGEHYLEFSTLAELSAIARFINENREEAEEIRRRGNAFALEHYSDEKLVGYLDALLYYPDSSTKDHSF